MRRKTYREVLVESMREMHNEGETWLYARDIGQRVTDCDEGYKCRYKQLSRVLGLIGIDRLEKPTKITSPGKLFPTLSHLEKEEIVASLWEFPDADIPDQRGRLMYRLVDLGQ